MLTAQDHGVPPPERTTAGTALKITRSVSIHIDAPKLFQGDATYALTPTPTGTRLEQKGSWRYADAFSRLMEPLVTPQANAKGARTSPG